MLTFIIYLKTYIEIYIEEAYWYVLINSGSQLVKPENHKYVYEGLLY